MPNNIWMSVLHRFRLLHAVPDEEPDESSSSQQELICGLSQLYQASQGSAHKKGRKRKQTCSFLLLNCENAF